MEMKSEWKKPKTINLYLHPPESRKLVTAWPDFKIVCASNEQTEKNMKQNYGIRFLFGDEAFAPDWQKTEFTVMPDGIPVHTLKYNYMNYTIELESFCRWEEVPPVFIRLKVHNNEPYDREFSFGVMLRTGLDYILCGIKYDFYTSYRPMLEQWDMIENRWVLRKNFGQDGSRRMHFKLPGRTKFKWIKQNKYNSFAKNYLNVSTRMNAKRHEEYYFTLNETGSMGSIDKMKYGLNRTKVISRWNRELKKIKVVPAVNSEYLENMYFSLVCQCLQMFGICNDNLVRPRQGGNNCNVWPNEAVTFLTALDRIGLNEWAKKGYLFLKKCQINEGEDKGRIKGSNMWTGYTGATLYGLVDHLKYSGKKDFMFWRESILDAVNWIQRQRNLTKNGKYKVGAGLFPPGKGHDWGTELRFWCFTDCYSYMGIKAIADIFKKFNDKEAKTMGAIADDYYKCLKGTLNHLYKNQKKKKEVFITNVLEFKKERYPPVGPYFCDGPTQLMKAGIIDPKSKLFRQVENYFRSKGWMKNGLTGLMTDSIMQQWLIHSSDPWAGHTWYTSGSDLCWFNAWLQRGERKKAEETFFAQIKYSMTTEFYMQERFADNDPTFCPWQPNASANGRTIKMLLDFFGTK